jgi:beta-lactamase regulating signal transducer with metallopeptidase domain
MSTVAHFLQAFAGGWLGVIGESSLKVALVLAVACAASLILRRAPAALKHLAWVLAIAGSLAMPILSGLLPRTDVSLPGVRVSAPLQSDVARLPVALAGGDSEGSARLRESDMSPMPATPALSERQRSTPWTGVLMLVWLSGLVTLLARVAFGFVMARRLVNTSERVTDSRWNEIALELARSVGLRNPVGLLVHSQVTVPMSSGWRASRILFPRDSGDWSEDRLRAVMLHEMAHMKRRDCQVQVMAQLACALYWFNPLVWVAAWRLRCERERACDDFVLQVGTRPSDYATHLLEIARAPRGPDWTTVATVAMARPSELEGRLIAILDPELKRRTTRSGLVVVVFGTVFLSGLVASLKPATGSARPGADNPLVADQTPGSDALHEGEAQAMDHSDTDLAAAAFISALEDPDPMVRKEAAFALGEIRSRRATAPLIAALEDPAPAVRHEAAFALGNRGDREAVPYLLNALNDESPGVRKEAAFALANIGDAVAVPGLIAALGDPSAAVRKEAAFALGCIGDPAEAVVTRSTGKPPGHLARSTTDSSYFP